MSLVLATDPWPPPEIMRRLLCEPTGHLDLAIWAYGQEVRVIFCFGHRAPLTTAVQEEAIRLLGEFLEHRPDDWPVKVQYWYNQQSPRPEVDWFQAKLRELLPGGYQDYGATGEPHDW